MRIADFAKKYHLSEQAIRGRIKRAGYVLDDLRQPGSGHFTEEGEKVITDLFSREPAAGTASGKGKGNTQGGSRSAGSSGALAIIRAERDELRTRAATAETLAAERERTIQFLKEQIREKDETIAKLATAAAVKAALPDPKQNQDTSTEHNRRGLFALFHRKKEK